MSRFELTTEEYRMLQEIVEGSFVDGSLRASYSGRGMYGDGCFGVICDSPAEAMGRIVFELCVNFQREDLAEELLDGMQTDSMGRGAILYWPGVTVEDAEELESETDEDDE